MSKQATDHFGIAKECIQSQRWADALVHSKRALELGPESALYNNNLAWLLVSCPDSIYRDAGLALQLARKAVELESDVAEYWNTLGVAYYRVGDWQQSIEGLTKAEQLKPNLYFGHNAFFLAMAHWQLGEEETARELFEQADQWVISTNPPSEHRREIEQFRAEAVELLRE